MAEARRDGKFASHVLRRDADPIKAVGSPFGREQACCSPLILPPLLARIRAEARLLRSHFGAEYDAYRARTSRLIPDLY